MTKEDMEGWLKSLKNRLNEKKIYRFSNFKEKTIKEIVRKGDSVLFIFFTDDSWSKLEIIEYSYEDGPEQKLELNDDAEISRFEMGTLFNGGLIDKLDLQTADKYIKDLDIMENDRRERKLYEELKRRFENGD